MLTSLLDGIGRSQQPLAADRNQSASHRRLAPNAVVSRPLKRGVMPLLLKSMLKRSAFFIGFVSSLLVFVAINVAIHIAVRDCCEFSGSGLLTDTIAFGGFPFPWYSNGSFKEPHVDWFALKVNIAIAVVASLAIGKIIQWVFVKPVPLNPKLKLFG